MPRGTVIFRGVGCVRSAPPPLLLVRWSGETASATNRVDGYAHTSGKTTIDSFDRHMQRSSHPAVGVIRPASSCDLETMHD